MTRFIQLSVLILLLFTVISCSMEKRVHRPGYHVEWLDSKKKVHVDSDDRSNEKKLESNPDNFEEIKKKSTTAAELPDVESEIILSASSDKLIFKTENTFAGKNFTNFSIQPESNENKSLEDFKLAKKDLKFLKKESAYDDNSDKRAIRTIGWVTLILGFLLLLFVSILIGALLMLLGLVFVLVGASKTGSSSSTKTRGQYVDVVYLKNGSSIRGMIIEQIPNQQLKIQTRDGNVFVYKMEEIEKITKELSK